MSQPKTARRGMASTVLALSALVVALAVLINVLVSGRTAPTPAPFLATTSLDAALARASEEGKVVFAVATADWCPACQVYKRGALADPRVGAWIEANAVPVYLDMTDGATEAAQRLGISAIPASFIIDSSDRVIARREGAVSPDRLIAWLEDATKDTPPAPRAD